MSILIYGIPTCSTCKKALQWLDANQISYEFIDTKHHPPTREQIAAWVATLGSAAMRNTSGQSYRALRDQKKNWTEDQWIEAFTQDAMLLRRPLFVRDETAVLAGFRISADAARQKLGL